MKNESIRQMYKTQYPQATQIDVEFIACVNDELEFNITIYNPNDSWEQQTLLIKRQRTSSGATLPLTQGQNDEH